MGQPSVIARRTDLCQALDERGLSLMDVVTQVATNGGKVSKSTLGFLRTRDGYGISLDKAEAIAQVVQLPVGRLFRHKNGDPIGGAA